MRGLIRFFLKLSLRLLALLAVVTWLVSRYFGVQVTGDVFSRPFSVVDCRSGLAFATANAGVYMWTIETMTPLDAMEAGWLFDPSGQDLRRFACSTPVPGLNIVTGSGRVMIAVTHWLLLVTALSAWLIMEWHDLRQRRKHAAD